MLVLCIFNDPKTYMVVSLQVASFSGKKYWIIFDQCLLLFYLPLPIVHFLFPEIIYVESARREIFVNAAASWLPSNLPCS